MKLAYEDEIWEGNFFIKKKKWPPNLTENFDQEEKKIN